MSIGPPAAPVTKMPGRAVALGEPFKAGREIKPSEDGSRLKLALSEVEVIDGEAVGIIPSDRTTRW